MTRNYHYFRINLLIFVFSVFFHIARIPVSRIYTELSLDKQTLKGTDFQTAQIIHAPFYKSLHSGQVYDLKML